MENIIKTKERLIKSIYGNIEQLREDINDKHKDIIHLNEEIIRLKSEITYYKKEKETSEEQKKYLSKINLIPKDLQNDIYEFIDRTLIDYLKDSKDIEIEVLKTLIIEYLYREEFDYCNQLLSYLYNNVLYLTDTDWEVINELLITISIEAQQYFVDSIYKILDAVIKNGQVQKIRNFLRNRLEFIYEDRFYDRNSYNALIRLQNLLLASEELVISINKQQLLNEIYVMIKLPFMRELDSNTFINILYLFFINKQDNLILEVSEVERFRHISEFKLYEAYYDLLNGLNNDGSILKKYKNECMILDENLLNKAYEKMILRF